MTIALRIIRMLLLATLVGLALATAYWELTTSPNGYPPSSTWSFK